MTEFKSSYKTLDPSNILSNIQDTQLKELIIASQILIDKIQNPNPRRFTISTTPQISKSLKDYGSDDYKRINTILRTIKKGDIIDEKIDSYIQNITRAMELVKPYRLKEKFIVWRGLKMPDSYRYIEEIKSLKNKRYLNNDSFLSTSYYVKSALKFADWCMFKIYVDPNEDLNYVVLDLEQEKEILFEQGTYFEYVGESQYSTESGTIPLFEVYLKKNQVIQEYKAVSRTVMSAEEFYQSVIQKIPSIVTDEVFKNEISTFEDLMIEPELKSIQESMYVIFNDSLKLSYPDNYKMLSSREEDIKFEVYKHTESLFLEKMKQDN
jgi:hypothetical protein